MQDIYGADILKEDAAKGRVFKNIAIFFLICLAGLYIMQTISPSSSHSIIPPVFILTAICVILVYLWVHEIFKRISFQEAAVKLSITQREILEANLDLIAGIVHAEEEVDPYTKNHCNRVTGYAMAIADKINMPKEQKEILRRSGVVHDVGKIGIIRKIINKPGKLTFEEWVQIKKYPEKSAEMLAPLKYLPFESEIIQYHHERYDGNGYPKGLKGEAIPMGSRILSIADAFDAMVSPRPYREKPLEKAQIIAELKNNSGIQFDPKIVDAFLDILEKDQKIWEKQ